MDTLFWTGPDVLVLLLAGLVVLAWLIAGSTSRAIRRVAAASRRLATGDLQTPVEAAGSGEVRAIAASLERIRYHLVEQKGVLEGLRGAAAAHPEREGGGQDEARAADLAGRASELAIFHAVALAVSRPAEAGPAYEPFLFQVLSYLGMDAGALYLAEGRELRLLAQAGHSPASVESMARLPLGEGIAGRAAQGDDALVMEDASAEARLVRDVVRLEGFHGLVAVPLAGRGRTLGVLELAARSRRKVGGHELMLLQAVAQHIGLALANVALHEEAERRAARLHTLARLTQSMTASLSPQDVLVLAVLAAAQLLELAYVRVWLWDPAAGRAQPGPWHGQADMAEEGAPADAAARAPEAQFAALAAEGGEAVFIPQIASDARCPDPRWWAKRGAVSLGALPLSIGERTLGVLTVVPRGASTFPEEDRELLGLLAGQAAVAFENARLYQERVARGGQAPGGLEEAPRAAAGPGLGKVAVAPAGAQEAAPAGVQTTVKPAAAAPPGPEAGRAAEALAGLDAAVAATDDVESALEVIADEVRHIVGAEVAAVFRLDQRRPDGTGRLLRLAAGGLQVGAGGALDGETGVVGAALAARAPRTAVPLFGESGGETLETLALSTGYRAVAAAPILRGEALVGALAVCRRGPVPFEPWPLAALAAVAARVAAIWEDRGRTAGLQGKA